VKSAARVIGVVGSGAMGAGIAQVAAVAGARVLLTDAAPGVAGRAVDQIRQRVTDRVAQGKLDADPAALELSAAADLAGLSGCDLVIEAIVEDLAAKRGLLAELEQAVRDGCVLATNTSSLSVTALGAALARPERFVGLHFFNPVPAMRLVEVVSGLATAPATADKAASLAAGWGKTVVRCSDTPGFIVNRVARPFYAEAWRLLEENAASPAVIDAVLTGAGGFRMGPFALMDLIGHDVNEAVTTSVWSAFGHDPRFAPALPQRALVQAGWLGRKSGRGVYEYGEGAAGAGAAPAQSAPAPRTVVEHGRSPLRPLLDRSGVAVITASHSTAPPLLASGVVELPGGALLAQCAGAPASALSAPSGRPVIVADRVLDPEKATAIAVAASDGCPRTALAEAVGLFQAAGLAVYVIDDAPGLIVTRTVAMLANLAADAAAARVASPADVDTAMKLGTGYPRGPLAWADQWGAADVLAILDALENWYRDSHYRPAPALRRAALSSASRSGGAAAPLAG
jgi:3-hydroxybutyryl-CoA dehydrogenase